MFYAGSEIRIIGHRGAAGVAPENTVVGIEAAVRTGAQAIEIDVRISADGHLVSIHDETSERTAGRPGRIAEMTLEEILCLDAGYGFTPDHGRSFPFRDTGVRFPTLDEAVEAAGDLPMVIEVKSAAAGRALAGWLRARRAERTDVDRFIVAGFERSAVAPAAEAASRECATRADLVPFILLGKLGIGGPLREEIEAIMLPLRKGPIRLVTRRFVRRAHARGVGVFVWTVNRPSVMRHLFDMGVDGLISDCPARVRRILDERVALGVD